MMAVACCWHVTRSCMDVTNVSADVQDTKEPACLRLFLDYQGLPLLWSWMVDVPSAAIDFKTQVQWFVCPCVCLCVF